MLSLDYSVPTNPPWRHVIKNDPLNQFLYHHCTGRMNDEQNALAFLEYIEKCTADVFNLPMAQTRVLHPSSQTMIIDNMPFIEMILITAAERSAFDDRLLLWMIAQPQINLWFTYDCDGLLYTQAKTVEVAEKVKEEMLRRLEGPGQINAPRDFNGWPALGIAIIASDLEATLDLIHRGASMGFKFEMENEYSPEGFLQHASEVFSYPEFRQVRDAWIDAGRK